MLTGDQRAQLHYHSFQSYHITRGLQPSDGMLHTKSYQITKVSNYLKSPAAPIKTCYLHLYYILGMYHLIMILDSADTERD